MSSPELDAEREVDLARWRRAVVALWWLPATVVVTALDRLVAEPLDLRWLPSDRVIDGAWMALVVAAWPQPLARMSNASLYTRYRAPEEAYRLAHGNSDALQPVAGLPLAPAPPAPHALIGPAVTADCGRQPSVSAPATASVRTESG